MPTQPAAVTAIGQVTHEPHPHTGDAASHSRTAEHTAWMFYAIAAAGSAIGQIWVASDRLDGRATLCRLPAHTDRSYL